MKAVCNILKVLAVFIGTFVIWQLLWRIFRKAYFFPAPLIVGKVMDNDFRRWFQPADKVIARSGIASGLTVLEVGCGSGAYTSALARAVEPGGALHAVDMHRGMLKQLEKKLAKPENADIRNVHVRTANAQKLPFDDAIFDRVVGISSFSEMADKKAALAEIFRVLKPDGTLSLSEFLFDPDYPFRGKIKKLARACGFSLESAQGRFWNYTMTFRRG